MPSASLERGVRGQRRSDLLMGEEGGEEKALQSACMNEGFVLAKAIGIIAFLALSISLPSHGHWSF